MIRLRVVLLEIVPPVWRRLDIPAQWTLRQLHTALRCAMGWSEGDSHRFRVGSALYGNTSERTPARDSRWITLGDIAAQGAKSFRYEIVSGESWEHEVLIESWEEDRGERPTAVCLGGERLWPPESAEGPDAWVERFDYLVETPNAAAFDLESLNRALARLG
ncbi:MAG TPA: plasmid pRiA4b ORF-3 family protein [Thermoanaerobaculia bacterium]|nr:plasmid pRiA4b ORF-3 family protein [Thermoanaerobaculia bacterium]